MCVYIYMCVCVCNRITSLFSRNEHTVNQLCTSIKIDSYYKDKNKE